MVRLECVSVKYLAHYARQAAPELVEAHSDSRYGAE